MKKIPNGLWMVIGAIVLGVSLYLSLGHVKSYERIVSVRGLCEREVMADRAIYPISYSEYGNDMGALYAKVKSQNKILIEFLKEQGFTDDEITVNSPSLTDRWSTSYGSNDLPTNRYVMTSVVTVCTDNVEAVVAMQKEESQLLEKGLAISPSNSWSNPVIYEYVGLNDIKPEMIEEANKNAREAADKFAKDSHSRIGKIQSATQGLFSISSRDSYTPYIKEIRVVTSVNYYLK